MNEIKPEPIRTYTGVIMCPLDPHAEDFNIADIAHALSQMTRANGHFVHFYSVAQHCIACSLEGEKRGYAPRLCLALLIHDASEAYLSDITRPVKISLPDYREIEKKLQKVLFSALGVGELSEEDEKMISVIDDDMLYYEFENLHKDGGLGKDYRMMGHYSLEYRNMEEVEDQYCRQYDRLIKMMGETE